MKSSSLVISAFAVIVFAGIATAATTPRIDYREEYQRARIRAGIESGALTRHEAQRLYREEARIYRREARRDRDGRMGPRERAELNRALDRQSRRIRRLEHNERERGI